MSLHIYSPAAVVFRHYFDCRTCKQRRRTVVRSTGWLGSTRKCCGCGQDPLGRPARFKTISRERAERIEAAKRQWAEALGNKEARQRFMDMVEAGL